MSGTTRVLGIDTSLRSTGVGVVEAAGSSFHAVAADTVRFAAKIPLSECLLRLSDRVRSFIQAHQPQAVAIEGVFFCKNARTALILGEARGAVIACCAGAGLPMYEYEPRRVKQAVVGFGAASKEQMQKMIMSLLHLPELPQEDAGDALALALCHLHNASRHAALQPDTI